MTKLCSCCQQPLPEVRAGIELSPLKTRIFDMIERAGADGVRLEDINAICFEGHSTAANIRVHIEQINGRLAETGLRLYGSNPRGFYRIIGMP